ncbi:MAG: hypothetical protein EOO15_09125 [Chitinophagaceae bacterium]|nr:MAG: hypothetical protein EOO15_09125 [Chitinophagaceae bacterium]
MPRKTLSIIITGLLLFFGEGQGQEVPPRGTVLFSTREFEASRVHRWLFGRNWRREWATPVSVPEVLLDTLFGGLKPYQPSGGGESRSLRLRTADGHEWVLRSVTKTRSALLPPLLRRSPYGALVQDGVSMSHPYAALALPQMLRAAAIPHTEPRLVFLPRQVALDTFNAAYADNVYLLEERAAGNWTDAPHLGGYKNYLATIEVKELLRHDNTYKPDQHAYLRARLFDILISDVDRHEGNWRWGVADTGTFRYLPVPVDRDQAFFLFDGLLSKLSLAATRRRLMQPFTYRVRNVATLTSHDQMLDRYFANEMTAADWNTAARELQEALTDDVIARAVAELPANVYGLSGADIVNKLQHRRSFLPDFAARLFAAMARKVEINGSEMPERFEVRMQPDGNVHVSVYRAAAAGSAAAMPFYQRTFSKAETKQITLYGFGGADEFSVDEKARGIRIKIVKGINEAQLKPAS